VHLQLRDLEAAIRWFETIWQIHPGSETSEWQRSRLTPSFLFAMPQIMTLLPLWDLRVMIAIEISDPLLNAVQSYSNQRQTKSGESELPTLKARGIEVRNRGANRESRT
jgi:hypothetical protein